MPTKKQKAGLGAVRPDNYTEGRFKEMASEMGLSQTEMFEKLFWYYISKEREEEQQQAIEYKSEINLISKELSNILNHFKGITEKAQETVLNITTNAEQTEKNLTTKIDTLSKRIEELKNRNMELEKTNNVFEDVKARLENEIVELKDTLKNKEIELTSLEDSVEEKNGDLKELRKQIESLEKDNDKQHKEVIRLSTELNNKATRIQSLDSLNNNLQNTLNSMDKLKKSEIESIETKYQSIISDMESKLKTFDEHKKNELENLENRIRTELNAEMKMAIADSKLELADMKSKYAESQATIEAINAGFTNRVNELYEHHNQVLQELNESHSIEIDKLTTKYVAYIKEMHLKSDQQNQDISNLTNTNT